MEIRRNAYSAFDACSWLESPLGLFQRNVCIVLREDNTINASRHGDKQGGVGELLHDSLEHLSNLYICYPKELLFQNRCSQRQLEKTVKMKVASDPSTVGCAELPCSRGREKGGNMLIGDVRYLQTGMGVKQWAKS